MPAVEAPQQQQPMEASPQDVVSQQPAAEPQPEMSIRGGFMEECSCCCFSEECACC
ncbi:hypothetical protein QBC33DRAFT_531807 [Phialemonium atrogriseum]|uniref:Uncharacterized protein n=1 Tax=Phialemonium atrogriseum TaxID=1093897 RepID=A0AAJ0C406_9PEZI|nr:uncharacterized protein QBC33DRAFT_531807 [Phialemonium atrogriseum]KAK1769733.1 hypothetical protein QBC33DRAFT_531807 [Phialemonium atrogriseum]